MFVANDRNKVSLQRSETDMPHLTERVVRPLDLYKH